MCEQRSPSVTADSFESAASQPEAKDQPSHEGGGYPVDPDGSREQLVAASPADSFETAASQPEPKDQPSHEGGGYPVDPEGTSGKLPASH